MRIYGEFIRYNKPEVLCKYKSQADKMREPVLITDGHWRKTLAAVRCLGRRGIPVTVGESTGLATACFSRYCRKALIYPSPRLEPEGFLEFMEKELRAVKYRMLLAMEEDTLLLLARHRERFEHLTWLPAVPAPRLELARDKAAVLALARDLGIPTPRTWQIKRLEQLETLKNRLPYPVVIKPRIGSGANGVSYIDHPARLQACYLATHRRHPFPLIQERIPACGTAYGASFLMDENGQVRASFVHRRLRQYPVSGGASTLRQSAHHPEIHAMGLALLKALNWFGVAMVEFKLDPRDGKPKLMEVNPRFWGSLALAIHAGIDFPYLLYRMAAGEKFAPRENYPDGKRCRWLLPGDILHFIHNPARARLRPSFFDFFDRQTAYDILSLKDPGPVIGRLLTPLTLLYDPDMRQRMEARRQ